MQRQSRRTRSGHRTAAPSAKKARSRPKSSKRAVTQTALPLQLRFRQRVPRDDQFILKLTEEQLGEIHQGNFGEPFPRNEFMTFIQSGTPVVVFESDKGPVGYYSYLVGPDRKMHVSALVIDSHYQSQGVGTHVMRHLEDEAAAQGVQTLEVFVQGNNDKSVAFTKQLGFVEMFRIPPNTICFQKRVEGQSAATIQRY